MTLTDRIAAIETELAQIRAALAAIEIAVEQLQFDIGHADRRSHNNSAKVTDASVQIGKVSDRVHTIEDLFEPGGAIALLERAVWALASDVEQLKRAKEQGS